MCLEQIQGQVVGVGPSILGKGCPANFQDIHKSNCVGKEGLICVYDRSCCCGKCHNIHVATCDADGNTAGSWTVMKSTMMNKCPCNKGNLYNNVKL